MINRHSHSITPADTSAHEATRLAALSKKASRSPRRRWRDALLLAAVLIASPPFAACAAPSPGSDSAGDSAHGASDSARASDVMAEVAGKPITLAELEAEAGGQLQQLALERSQLLEQALEGLIAARLLEAEADRRGATLDTVLADADAAAKSVTDADVDQFYTQNQARIRQPKEAIAGQIRDYLQEEAKREVRTALVTRLRGEQKVSVYFEPLRMDVDDADAPFKGPADAPVTLVEFFDFQCPPCRQLAPTIERVVATYPQQVRVVYRHFPLHSIHPQAQEAAEASMCAQEQDPKAFFTMHDALFASQEKLKLGRESLVAQATELGLDGAELEACLESGRFREAVASDQQEGQQAGVGGTPTIFVNGQTVAMPRGSEYEALASAIDKELTRLGAKTSR